MRNFRYPVSCIVVMAAAFHGGMPPAVAAIAGAGEMERGAGNSDTVPAQQAVRALQDVRSSGPHPSVAADERSDQETISHAPRFDEAEPGPPHEEAVQPVAVPLERDVEFVEVVVGPGGEVAESDGGGVAGDDARLIYSNTLGIEAINFPANWPVSDDIATTAPDGCYLRTFKFKVLGRVRTTCNGGANSGNPCTSNAECPGGTCFIGGPYTVKYALYTNCPLAVGAAPSTAHLRELVKIPGTSGEITFPDDGPRAIKHVVDQHNPVAIPTNVYLGLQFNRSNCGTVIGAPAMVGFSADQWDFPGFPCNGFLGGFPQLPHASFWLEMYGDSTCPASFPGYKSAKASGPTALLGAGVQGVDDVKLQVEDCQMVGYEVAVRGVGFYHFDLRRHCDGQIIPGTERTFQVNEGTVPLLQMARFTFNPPIALLDDDLFLAFRSSSNSSGAVVAGIQPIIGESVSDYYVSGPGGCGPVLPQQGLHGAINLAVTCAGALPTGACCDMGLLECEGGSDEKQRCNSSADCNGGTCEAVCREVQKLNCPWPPAEQSLNPAWIEGGVCEPDPFELPCGLAACCKPDDTCENLTKNECAAVPPLENARLWQAGLYCGQDSQSCPFTACLARNGSCSLIHDWGGCSDPFCCSPVCAIDPWCCHVEWDRGCVELAGELCTRPPSNDTCGNVRGQEPVELFQSTPVFGSNLRATESIYDTGFCCHESDPGARGYGTVWFKFVATHESAQIDTCASDPEGDTLVSVFSVGDSADALPCYEPLLIGCGDNDGCPVIGQAPASQHSRFCVNGLTVGQTYFIMLASKMPQDMGTFQIEMASPCQTAVLFSTADCNENNILDGCDISTRFSLDCDGNSVPDECDLAEPSPDCDGDGVVDTCDPLRQWIAGIPPSKSFGASVAIDNDVLVAGDPYFGSEPYLDNGLVRVFELDNGKWNELLEIHPPDQFYNPRFGASVDLSGEWMLVTATGDTDQSPYIRGRVYAYQRESSNWQLREFPRIEREPDLDETVAEVVVDGDLAAVSVSNCDYNKTNCDLGMVVHVFRRTADFWLHEARIPNEGSFERWAFDMQLDDGTLVVSTGGLFATVESSLNDYIYVYERQSGQWELTDTFGLYGDFLPDGISIAFDNDLVVVPVSYHSDFFQHIVGHTYRRTGSSWSSGYLIDDYNSYLSTPWPSAVILSNGLIGVTARNYYSGCVRALLYNNFGGPALAATLESGHCREDARKIILDADAGFVAMGMSPNPENHWSEIAGSVRIFSVPPVDCDYSGNSDLCEINDGLLEDCNNDQVADVCQSRAYIDYNLDLRMDLRDAAGLQNCFSGTSFIAPCCGVFDVYGPVGIGVVDFAAFVGAMTGP